MSHKHTVSDAPSHFLKQSALAIVIMLVGASCGGASDSTTTSTSSADAPSATSSTSSLSASTAEVASYLAAVLEASIEAQVGDPLAAIGSATTPEELARATRDMSAEYGRQLEILESLTPPEEAVDYHDSMVDLTRRYRDLLASPPGSEDEAARYQQLSMSLLQDSVEVAAEDQRLTNLVLGSRSDPLSQYLLATLASQEADRVMFEDFLSRFQQATVRGDIDALHSVIALEIEVMDASIGRWSSLSPPEEAAVYHQLQLELQADMRNAATAALVALENEDLSALEAASRQMIAAGTGSGDLLLLRTELLIAALRGAGSN